MKNWVKENVLLYIFRGYNMLKQPHDGWRGSCQRVGIEVDKTAREKERKKRGATPWRDLSFYFTTRNRALPEPKTGGMDLLQGL